MYADLHDGPDLEDASIDLDRPECIEGYDAAADEGFLTVYWQATLAELRQRLADAPRCADVAISLQPVAGRWRSSPLFEEASGSHASEEGDQDDLAETLECVNRGVYVATFSKPALRSDDGE